MKGLIRKLLREGLSEIKFIPIDFENDDGEYDIYSLSDEAQKMAKSEGLNILRGKELRYVVIDGGKMVLGALWTEVDGNEFSFDVVVSKSAQGRGLGDKLVRLAMEEFNSQNYDGQLIYKIDVTNPAMERILLKYGFSVVDKIGGHTIMTRPR
jgi:ribosomal protein S18 acetylase RimI-like enzyme